MTLFAYCGFLLINRGSFLYITETHTWHKLYFKSQFLKFFLELFRFRLFPYYFAFYSHFLAFFIHSHFSEYPNNSNIKELHNSVENIQTNIVFGAKTAVLRTKNRIHNINLKQNKYLQLTLENSYSYKHCYSISCL